jgi:RNA polymerase sigma factor (sigma-70 family)
MADALPDELSRLLRPADANAREAAWAAFLETHSRLLLSVCRTMGRDHDRAMDAYTFLLDQLRRDDFHRLRGYLADGRGKFTTWLVVVARRLCLDFARQRYGRVREHTSSEAAATRRRLVDLVSEDVEAAGAGSDPAPGPDQAVLDSERADAVSAVLGALAPRDRLLLKLRFDDDLPAREIARVMGFPTPFHVYRRVNALLAELRAALARRGLEETGA